MQRVGRGIIAPLSETAGITVMANEAPAETVFTPIGFAAVKNVAVEEDNVAGPGGSENLIVFIRDRTEGVVLIVGIADAGDIANVGNQFVPESIGDLRAGWIDRLVAGTFGEPHCAVLLVAIINGDPRPQRVSGWVGM